MDWAASPIFHHVRDILEVIYFLSTVALAVVAAYGLQQIRIMKQDIKIRNERAAKEQAISVSERFIKCAEHFRIYLEALKQNGMGVYTGPVKDFTNTSLSNEAVQVGLRKWQFINSWMAALNELEALSASYMSGVADEQLGYTILGIGFCLSVQQTYDVICLHRGDGGPTTNYWKNMIGLYKIWSERAKKEGLLKKFGEIAEQLRLSPDETVKPIGV